MSATDAESSTARTHTHDTGLADADLLQLVSFVIGDEEFAVPILAVQEINRMMQITRVPQSQAFVEGVINLRGRIIPVISLRERFGMPRIDSSNEMRIIVVEVNDRVIGFTVDRVNEVLRIAPDIVDPAPGMCTSVDGDYVQGVGKLEDRLLILLSLDRLFSADELVEAEAAANHAS
jgi:purine-binding chemotaxis protein CheW